MADAALGVCLTAAAYLVGGLVFYSAAVRRRLDTSGFGFIAAAGLCGGVLGARVTEWGFSQWSVLAAQPAILLDPRAGGRTLIGGILCGWVAVEAAKWSLGIRRSSGDMFALALPAGEILGRLGCFFNGCCFGTPSNLPWAVYQHGCWRHPAQIYSAVAAAGIFYVLYSWRDRMRHEGDLFRWFLILYGSCRFLLEFVRDHPNPLPILSTAQIICLLLVGVGWVGLRRQILTGG